MGEHRAESKPRLEGESVSEALDADLDAYLDRELFTRQGESPPVESLEPEPLAPGPTHSPALLALAAEEEAWLRDRPAPEPPALEDSPLIEPAPLPPVPAPVPAVPLQPSPPPAWAMPVAEAPAPVPVAPAPVPVAPAPVPVASAPVPVASAPWPVQPAPVPPGAQPWGAQPMPAPPQAWGTPGAPVPPQAWGMPPGHPGFAPPAAPTGMRRTLLLALGTMAGVVAVAAFAAGMLGVLGLPGKSSNASATRARAVPPASHAASPVSPPAPPAPAPAPVAPAVPAPAEGAALASAAPVAEAPGAAVAAAPPVAPSGATPEVKAPPPVANATARAEEARAEVPKDKTDTASKRREARREHVARPSVERPKAPVASAAASLEEDGARRRAEREARLDAAFERVVHNPPARRDASVPQGAQEDSATARASEPKKASGYEDFDEEFARELGFTDKRPQRPARPAANVYVPPAVGDDVPERLSASDIMGVVVGQKAAVAACIRQHKQSAGGGGRLVARWSIRPDGSTSGIEVETAQHRGTPLARCLEGLVRSWRFPRHRVAQAEPVRFPFTF